MHDRSLFFILICIIFFVGCASMPPSFRQASNVEWSAVQIRDGLEFERAWGEVLDVIARKFEMEMISKDGGYARSGWIYTWNPKGEYKNYYRVRVLFNFSADKKNVYIKAEAQFMDGNTWVIGFDTDLLETVKTDVMGVVGRTAR